MESVLKHVYPSVVNVSVIGNVKILERPHVNDEIVFDNTKFGMEQCLEAAA